MKLLIFIILIVITLQANLLFTTDENALCLDGSRAVNIITIHLVILFFIGIRFWI